MSKHITFNHEKADKKLKYMMYPEKHKFALFIRLNKQVIIIRNVCNINILFNDFKETGSIFFKYNKILSCHQYENFGLLFEKILYFQLLITMKKSIT